MARHRFDEVQLDLIAAVITVLEEPAGGLMQDAGRRLWRQMVEEALDGVPQDTYSIPHQEFLSLVHACAGHPGGLETLVRVTALVAPALDRHLQPLLDEWRAHEVYRGRDWRPLRDALQPRLSELATLVAESTSGRHVLPPHCATPWQAVVHLADLNSPVGGLPPAMALLERLALRPELASAIGEIRAWNDHFAEKWGMLDGTDGLRNLRRNLDTAHRTDRVPVAVSSSGTYGSTGGGLAMGAEESQDRPAQEGPPLIHLYIRVAPDRTPQPNGRRRTGRPPRYHVSACVKYADSPALQRAPEAEAEKPVPRDQLAACVADLLTRMAELWHNRSEDVALEFFLPLELLTEPVEWWDRDPERDFPNPLLSTYRVSVHSLDRVQRRKFHRAWRARWTQWRKNESQWRENGSNQEHTRRVVHECAPEPTLSLREHLTRLDAAVGSDDDVVGMLLCEPPWEQGKLGMQEVSLALDLGVPVLMYHREDVATPAWRAAVRDALAEDGLAGLPRRTRQWKTDAAVGRLSAHDLAAIRAMGMIWDDPEHLLDGGPSAPATFVGGTD
ncbi:VMAP-C domain-containing protein [Streptomyces spinosirectus]